MENIPTPPSMQQPAQNMPPQPPLKNSKKPKKTTIIAIAIIALLIIGAIVYSVTRPSGNDANMPTETQPTQPVDPENPQTQDERGIADVVSVGVEIIETFPVQARAMVSGNFANGCESLDVPEMGFDARSNRFIINLYTLESTETCTQALVPFTEYIDLDVIGLPAGTYEVLVNGKTAQFVLDVDNGVEFELDKG